MQKRLLYVSRLNSFTSDDTGEVVKGGIISRSDNKMITADDFQKLLDANKIEQ